MNAIPSARGYVSSHQAAAFSPLPSNFVSGAPARSAVSSLSSTGKVRDAHGHEVAVSVSSSAAPARSMASAGPPATARSSAVTALSSTGKVRDAHGHEVAVSISSSAAPAARNGVTSISSSGSVRDAHGRQVGVEVQSRQVPQGNVAMPSQSQKVSHMVPVQVEARFVPSATARTVAVRVEPQVVEAAGGSMTLPPVFLPAFSSVQAFPAASRSVPIEVPMEVVRQIPAEVVRNVPIDFGAEMVPQIRTLETPILPDLPFLQQQVPQAFSMPLAGCLQVDSGSELACYVGAAVQIYSKTFDAWLEGTIKQTGINAMVLTEFMAPDGRYKEKWMPIDHPDLCLSHPVFEQQGAAAQSMAPQTEMEETRVMPPMQVIASAEWIGPPAGRHCYDPHTDFNEAEQVEFNTKAAIIAAEAQREFQAAKADEAIEAARVAEDAKARLEEENLQLRARFEALQAQVQQEDETRESMTSIAERVNHALARLNTYETATAEASAPTSEKTLPPSPKLEPLEAAPAQTGGAPMVVSPYAGPLHGLYIMNLPLHTSALQLPPLSMCLASDSLHLYEDLYTVRRADNCIQAVTMGSSPLERQAGGLYFEVRISGTVDSNSGGIAIGVTHTAPTTFGSVLPMTAEDVPLTVAVGYAGTVYLNGCERQTNWNPQGLQISQRVGLLITDDGRGDLIVFEDQQPVVLVDGFALRDAGLLAEPLYPIIEVFGATSGVTLVPRAMVPSQRWDHLEPAQLQAAPEPPLDLQSAGLLQSTRLIGAGQAPIMSHRGPVY